MDESLERLIGWPEEKKKRDLIERLKEEKLISDQNWQRWGIFCGKREGYNIGYQQLAGIERLKRFTKDIEIDFEPFKLIELFRKQLGEAQILKFNKTFKSDSSVPLAEYLSGWLDGAISLWNEVKDKLD